MIVGININMHKASNAGLGHHHHHPANLEHNSMNNVSSTTMATAVGPASTDRLTYATDHNNNTDDGTASDYTMHHLHQQYQHYDSFNSSSQQSTHSILNTASATTNAPHQIYVSDDVQHLPQQHTGMLGLEQQFAQFHMQPPQQEGENSDHPSEIPNDEYVTEADNTLEGEETEEEPVKLFVGQVSGKD
jgi:hypothetical protein